MQGIYHLFLLPCAETSAIWFDFGLNHFVILTGAVVFEPIFSSV